MILRHVRPVDIHFAAACRRIAAMTTSVVVGTAVFLVVVALLAAGACVWLMAQRARQPSREIDAQIVEIHARIAESHVENHRNIDAVNKRLDHTEARIDESHRTIHAVNKRLDHTEARIDESHRTIHAVNKRLDHTEARIVESHRTIHAVNKRLDHTEARIAESHRTIHAVNKRLDHLARIEQFARIDRAASAVHQAASEGRLPAVARKKLIAHLDEVRDELSASEPGA